MAQVVYAAKDCKYLMAEQAVWGTAIADNAAVMSLDAVFSIARDIKMRQHDGAQGTRNRTYNDLIFDVKRSAPTFNVEGLIKRDELAFFLYAMFQNVTEGATTPYSKAFTFPAVQPDFTVDAGMFLTFWEQFPAATSSWKVIDAVCQSLELRFPLDEPAKFNAGFMARGAATTNAAPSGTATRAANTLYYLADAAALTIDFGSGAVAVIPTGDLVFTFQQELVKIGQASGNFQNFGIINRTHTFEMNILKDAAVTSALANHQAGTAITGVARWGNATPGTDAGDLNFGFTAKITDVGVSKDGTLTGNIKGEIAASTSATEPITVTFADAVDRTW